MRLRTAEWGFESLSGCQYRMLSGYNTWQRGSGRRSPLNAALCGLSSTGRALALLDKLSRLDWYEKFKRDREFD